MEYAKNTVQEWNPKESQKHCPMYLRMTISQASYGNMVFCVLSKKKEKKCLTNTLLGLRLSPDQIMEANAFFGSSFLLSTCYYESGYL